MKESILFNAEMVEAAFVDKTKTETRRIINPQPVHLGGPGKYLQNANYGLPAKELLKKDDNPIACWATDSRQFLDDYCPYKVGQKVYVKQSFQITKVDTFHGTISGQREDGSLFIHHHLTSIEWNKFVLWKDRFAKKSKLFMFKSLAYRWIEITGIRVERLQDITDEGADREGVDFIRHYPDADETLTARELFEYLWDSINAVRKGKPFYPWASNPWVFVYEFKPIL